MFVNTSVHICQWHMGGIRSYYMRHQILPFPVAITPQIFSFACIKDALTLLHSQVQRDLEHHRSKLAEAAAKAEEMLLPPWLARRVDAGVAKAKQLYETVAASEAAVAGLKYWDQAKEAAAPHVATAKVSWGCTS